MVLLSSPVRAVDTRTGTGGFTGQIQPGSDRCFTVAGVAGVPADASGVVVNLPSVGYGSDGWLTLYPAGQSLPQTSTLNFDTHEYAIANGAMVRLGTSGQVCIDAGASGSCAIVDVTGYVTSVASSSLTLLSNPVRPVDTRTGDQVFKQNDYHGAPTQTTSQILQESMAGAVNHVRL